MRTAAEGVEAGSGAGQGVLEAPQAGEVEIVREAHHEADDSFDIATLRFEAVGPGSTDLIVSGGTFAARVDSISGSAITPVFEPTNVSVLSAVPEADSWAMMLAGLGMLGWHARRRLTT